MREALDGLARQNLYVGLIVISYISRVRDDKFKRFRKKTIHQLFGAVLLDLHRNVRMGGSQFCEDPGHKLDGDNRAHPYRKVTYVAASVKVHVSFEASCLEQ